MSVHTGSCHICRRQLQHSAGPIYSARRNDERKFSQNADALMVVYARPVTIALFCCFSSPKRTKDSGDRWTARDNEWMTSIRSCRATFFYRPMRSHFNASAHHPFEFFVPRESEKTISHFWTCCFWAFLILRFVYIKCKIVMCKNSWFKRR